MTTSVIDSAVWSSYVYAYSLDTPKFETLYMRGWANMRGPSSVAMLTLITCGLETITPTVSTVHKMTVPLSTLG